MSDVALGSVHKTTPETSKPGMVMLQMQSPIWQPGFHSLVPIVRLYHRNMVLGILLPALKRDLGS